MAPINIAPDVLDCHREGAMHYPGYYRPCEKYNVEKRWQSIIQQLSSSMFHFYFRKLIAKNKAEGRLYIAKQR